MSAQSSIRIIGGKWRSRKVSFKTQDMLRPTPDRVRETIFNWLAPFLSSSVCMDLFAGSGVLGFEALSRGAKQVFVVERDRESAESIKHNRGVLEAYDMQIVNRDVLDWLQGPAFHNDIVFVDPPYKLNLLDQIFALLDNNAWISKDSLIYFEQASPYAADALPRDWEIWRESKAGNVYFYLARKK